MKATALKCLEFDKIATALQSFAETTPGREGAREIYPSADEPTVRAALRATTAARRRVDDGKDLPLGGLPDIRSQLELLSIEDRVLEVGELLELARFSLMAERVRASDVGDGEDTLFEMVRSLAELAPLATSIEKAIDRETSEVRDDASPQLRTIRARLFKLRSRLRSILESYLRQRDSRKILQDEVITERNGRAVLPVKAECRSQLVGIVHGTSASGATVFIEPLSTVELNNDIVSLEESERQEIHRILLSLTRQARERLDGLTQAAEILTRLDILQAKARLSASYRGAEPVITTDKTFHLIDACHPLLLAGVAERAGDVTPDHQAVPISFRLDSERSALVFTGPNTGGKTVALKTAGLLALMAQAGLHVPSGPESRFPVFRQIFADIGDEQSIGGSLSTFSAHLNNIVSMERELEEPSLVLLDEVGTGTDPAEGGPLGTALVDHFRQRGAWVLASTHHDMLKAYAATTPGVGAASFQFDPETYEPTYRLLEDSSGRSLAFEVALRLGLPESIVAHARELQNQKERQVQELLQQLEVDSDAIARDRKRLDEERRTLEEIARRRAALDRDDERAREERLRAFHEEIRSELARVRSELRNALEQAQRQITSAMVDTAELKAALRQVERETHQQMAVATAQIPLPPATATPLRNVSAGDRVQISALGLTGTVVETLSQGEVEVRVRDKKLRIPMSELAPPSGEPSSGEESPIPGRARHAGLPERKTVPHELNVIGCSVDEALSQADKFLDDAFLSDHRTVRLIHGHGTGRLRRALQQWLATHPHVSRHQSEGSGAVTVVELKS